MKKLFLLGIATFCIALLSHAQTASIKVEEGNPSSMAKFKWVSTTHNFGKIQQGKPVSHEFTFTNDGSSPLVISNVKGSCGCTVTNYTKEPIAPGKTGMVKATFNAAAAGSFNKSIRVTANVEGATETLYIKGEVVKENL